MLLALVKLTGLGPALYFAEVDEFKDLTTTLTFTVHSSERKKNYVQSESEYLISIKMIKLKWISDISLMNANKSLAVRLQANFVIQL